MELSPIQPSPKLMTSNHKRDLHRAEDDAWTRAMELALTPVVAGAIGYGLDRLIGIVPVFTITFLVLAVVATFFKMYYAYDAEMKEHDAKSPWGRAAAMKANGGQRSA